jgi:transcriptional accessory protein Tex/SPT6
VDREINSVEDLKVGETVRGFVKSIPEHGIFVTLGRWIDARVQIKELFDEVLWNEVLIRDHPILVITVREGVAASFSSKPARERPYLQVELLFLTTLIMQLNLRLASTPSIKRSS